MKKHIVFVAGLLLAGASVSFAQVDTTNSRSNDASASQANPALSGQPQQPDQNYRKDMSKIKSSEVPANLNETLNGSQYSGWEQGTIYRSKNNDAYVLEMNTNGQTQVHRFGADGKPLRDN